MKPLNRKNYGSIPHLLGSKIGMTDKYVTEGMHNILTKKTRDKNDYIYVTEKYDGSNVGIAKKDNKIYALTRSGYEAKTSKYKQHHLFSEWVYKNETLFKSILKNNERLTGEWLLQVHSIRYKINNNIPFVAFDLFDPSNKRYNYNDFWLIFNGLINMVRILTHGNKSFNINDMMKLLNSNEHENIKSIDKPEGIVYRVERNGVFDFAAKYVRNDFEPGKYCIGIDENALIWNAVL